MRLLLISLLVLTVAYANQAAADHARPHPPELLSPPPDSRRPIRVSRTDRAVQMRWSMPRKDLAVMYYVEVFALHGRSAEPIIAMYASPPFTFEHPRFDVPYAWRVTAVDENDKANTAPSGWAFFVVEPAD
jgi:hypothetical protein